MDISVFRNLFTTTTISLQLLYRSNLCQPLLRTGHFILDLSLNSQILLS